MKRYTLGVAGILDSMKIFLAAAVPFDHQLTAIPKFRELADKDRYGIHTLTDNAATADVILFVDPHQHFKDWPLKAIRSHSLTLKYPHKVLVYDERDITWCALPGVYVSMPKSAFNPQCQRAYGYHTTFHEFDAPLAAKPNLLFSFLGARSHKVRDSILKLSHPRAYVAKSSVGFFDFLDDLDYKAKVETQKQKFVELMGQTKFVLCPRGVGASSIRLFETLAAGRVPVIISDEWVAPVGPNWDNCSIRVNESAVAAIPKLLELNESRFEEMAFHAREVYENWFSPEVTFHHLAENCKDILQNGQVPIQKKSLLFDRQYQQCNLYHAKLRLRDRLVHIKKNILKT